MLIESADIVLREDTFHHDTGGHGPTEQCLSSNSSLRVGDNSGNGIRGLMSEEEL